MRTFEKPVKLYIIRKVLTRSIQNLSDSVKSYGHLIEIFTFLLQTLTKYDLIIWTTVHISAAI